MSSSSLSLVLVYLKWKYREKENLIVISDLKSESWKTKILKSAHIVLYKLMIQILAWVYHNFVLESRDNAAVRITEYYS